MAIKHNLQALVVHQQIVTEAQIARARAGGRFKLIVPIDWPKGETFGMTKMRGLSIDAMDVDGFEIMLTPGKTMLDTRNEARVLTEFVKKQLGDSIEVRFVLGVFSRTPENIIDMCNGLLTVRTPSMIRLDHQLKLQINKANQDAHNEWIDKVLAVISAPIKISGNITNIRTITGCEKAKRVALNLLQARTIIREHAQQPEPLKELLSQ